MKNLLVIALAGTMLSLTAMARTRSASEVPSTSFTAKYSKDFATQSHVIVFNHYFEMNLRPAIVLPVIHPKFLKTNLAFNDVSLYKIGAIDNRTRLKRWRDFHRRQSDKPGNCSISV